jgi:hypothetical protein
MLPRVKRPTKKAPSKPAAKKKTTKTAAKKRPASKAVAGKAALAAKTYAQRGDLGKPVDGFFAKVKDPLRPVTDELRALVTRVAPDARSSIKWGMPFYEVGGATMCAIAVHKSHVNLILAGPPGSFADPDGLLAGEGKTGRHLKVTSPSDLPREKVRRWLETAADLARASQK